MEATLLNERTEPVSLADVRALHDSGRTLSAWRLGRAAFGPLREWRGADARVLAGRILEACGAPRAARFSHVSAFRADRKHPDAAYYAVLGSFSTLGPLGVLKLHARVGPPEGADRNRRASWILVKARAYADLRDFESADAALREAVEVAPGEPWVEVERAVLLGREDRYDEALAAGRRALALRPLYRPAVQSVAHMLQLLDRDAEALELLREAYATLEHAGVSSQLAALETELGEHQAARATWRRVVEQMPEMELDAFCWLNSRLSDAAYDVGDLDEALERARISQSPFHLEVAARLEARAEGRRVLLPVRFVRQHHMTCAPATLSAISAHWDLPAGHLQLAEEICYDGTPAHSERRWAAQSGWAVREFRVTWESATALLDRGIPFTLTTLHPGGGHLQAAIGYDARRGTLVVRDPTFRNHGELEAAAFLEAQKAGGPRGMALVPAAKAHLLDGVDLPDALLYDLLHRLDGALTAHDRGGAKEALAELQRDAPDHRLTLQARRALASYDGDELELLACADALLQRYPDDVNFVLSKLACLSGLGRRAEAREVLAGAPKRHEPLLWSALAAELEGDAREDDRVESLSRRTILHAPGLGRAYGTLANLEWNRGRRAAAAWLYRFAACLDDKHEGRAWSYFAAERNLGREGEALRFLEDRFRRFGKLAGWPARTWFRALDALNRHDEAFRVLDEAIALRPEDGDLMLFAADQHGRFGRLDRARQVLAAAEPRVKRTQWQRQAAALHDYAGEPGSALRTWLAVLEAEPLAMDAHERATELLADLEGPQAALKHLDAATARFPHHVALQRLRLRWLRPEDPARAAEAAKALCEAHPADGWVRREFAIVLQQLGRDDEALTEIAAAERIEPRAEATFNVKGSLLEHLGRIEEARACYRESLRVGVDQPWALNALLRTCATNAERAVELAFVRDELRTQTLFGDALLEWRDFADGVLPPEEILAELQRALEKNRGLWHAWSAVIRQLLVLGRRDEALELARAAVGRFPLIAGAFRDLAAVHADRNDAAGEKAALEQALALSPGWADAVRLLASAYGRDGDHVKVRALLERAVTASPADSRLHFRLAETLDKLGERPAAIERLERGLRLDPASAWGWERLVEWSAERAATLARAIAEQRPHSAASWLGLAHALPQDALQDRLAALERATDAAPRSIDAHDLRAQLLAEAGRFAEAEAACAPAAFGESIPTPLRGRRIWLVAQQGDVAKAAEQMRALVAEERDYAWGLSRVIDWSRKLGDKKGLLAAAEQLAAAYPRDAWAHGAVGEALLESDPSRAREALERAHLLDPAYEWAGQTLFDRELEDGDLKAAAQTLERLDRSAPGPFVDARATQLAVRRMDKGEALRRFQKIAAETSLPSTWIAQAAVTSFASAWPDSAWHVLDAEVAAGTTSPELTAEWAARRPRLGWRRLWRADAKLRVAAVRAYLEKIRKTLLLPLFVWLYRAPIRAELQLWGSTGYALYDGGHRRLAARWLADYRERKPEPWMLVNLICANHAFGRHAQADAAALFLSADDAKLASWAAFAHACAGRSAEANALLAGPPPNDFYQSLHALAAALAAEDFAEASSRLDAAREKLPRGPLGRMLYFRTLKLLGRKFPRGATLFWRLRRRMQVA